MLPVHDAQDPGRTSGEVDYDRCAGNRFSGGGSTCKRDTEIFGSHCCFNVFLVDIAILKCWQQQLDPLPFQEIISVAPISRSSKFGTHPSGIHSLCHNPSGTLAEPGKPRRRDLKVRFIRGGTLALHVQSSCGIARSNLVRRR